MERAVAEVMSPSPRPNPRLEHKAALLFRRGRAMPVEASVRGGVASVQLRYRHVNQAEMWQAAEMQPDSESAMTASPRRSNEDDR